MRPAELKQMAVFFEHVRAGQAFLAAAQEQAASGGCGCELGRNGFWELHGSCIDHERRPAFCRTLTHLAVRVQMDQLRLPNGHLSDPQMDEALAAVVDLIGRAGSLTQRRFVIELQEHLRTSLLPLVRDAV